ncbi:DNA topoisomerase [Bradyrhizobium cenepequi]|uniref:DNA topoisomerase n=1 Tax=Bradyrhizobium cenepequi TaxID=2821403 RepID=UPI001CE2D293|nr:DNA topoisomerase [Bradyrhizobium cenepequi]MCA6110455.1 DNA topoisomerase III [Bradyrhizobium cenepequi]
MAAQTIKPALHQKPGCELATFSLCSSRAPPIRFRPEGLAWLVKSSSRKNPARRKTSALPLGSRYGDVLPAEGHLFDLLEPEDVVPEWKRWSPILLRPDGLYGTRPAEGGNKAAKLKAIREALRTAQQVWLATDCDREGQLIGQEILEHYNYRGRVLRVLFTAQDAQTIRDAFDRAKPNAEYARLYAAAVARRQADQIYNLSLTRTATVILGQGARSVIGVGRVKTPTLAIVCKRELEIRNFVPLAYFEVVATAKVVGGQFQIRHAPQERIVRREVAQDVVNAAQGFAGALAVRVEDKRQGPPKLHDLPSLHKLCGSRFGWPASKTLEVAQELYDGQGKKIITYPRAEVRYLPQSLISDVPTIVAGLQVGQSFSAIPLPEPPIIRKGASGSFYDKGLEGASHHAVIPNVNTIDQLREVWPRLSSDEKKLFDVIARAYLAALMPDFRYRQTTATLDVRGFEFRASGRQPIDLGWRAAFPHWQPGDEKGEAQLLPALHNGETAQLQDPQIEDKETRPPPRYNEGTLIDAMQNAWRFVDDEVLRERLKEAKGIGTPATRAEIIGGLKKQSFLMTQGKHILPTETGLSLFGVLKQADPALVDPGVTAQLECLLDDVVVGKQEMVGAIDAVCDVAQRIIGKLKEGATTGGLPSLGVAVGNGAAAYPPKPAMKRFADSIIRQKGSKPPPGYKTSISICRRFLSEHAPKTATAETPGEHKPVSPAQLLYAKKIAHRKGVMIPNEAKANSAAMSAWIDSNRDTKRRKPSRKTAYKPARSAARPSTAPKKPPRKRKATAAAAASTTAQANSAPGTPLRIPYGNKDIALKLGARYRSGGWYAPPGVDLAAFGERGWL